MPPTPKQRAEGAMRRSGQHYARLGREQAAALDHIAGYVATGKVTATEAARLTRIPRTTIRRAVTRHKEHR